MLLIRTDANTQIATGHAMRCMAIASEIKARGEQVRFVVADCESENVILPFGFDCHVLNTDYSNMEGEIEVICSYLDVNQTPWMLVDSYYVTNRYFKAIREKVKVVYIDDLMDGCAYPCDMIINYSAYADEEYYNTKYPNTIKLLGPSFAPLRKEFSQIPTKEYLDRGRNVLVMIGGSDPYHFMLQFTKYLVEYRSEFSDVTFNLICGRFNKDIDAIKDASQYFHNINIISHTNSILEYMKQADLAISAGGSTLYELCACGVLTMTFSYADNQIQNVKAFHDRGLMDYLGDVREEFYYEKIIYEVCSKINTLDKYKDIPPKMMNYVDGKGADRIAEVIMRIIRRQ